MKSSNLVLMPSLALAFIAASCGQQQNTQSTDTTTDTNTVVSTPVTPATTNSSSNFDTTPQLMLVMQHRVADYNQWQLSFDARDSIRRASGIHSYNVGRSIADSNHLVVATTAEDLARAKAFTRDPALKQAMKKGGVLGSPVISLFTLTFRNTTPPGTEYRSMTTFTVKDWDTWRRRFDSTRQARVDNGLVDRAYGHDADNNRKVVVVVALTDTARAYAFWKSDTLKKMQAASGVTSRPERFIYRVVKRY